MLLLTKTSNASPTVVVDRYTAKDSKKVLFGVPQGTVPCPLRFLLYINDIADTIPKGSPTRLFADDCLMIQSLRKNHEDKDHGMLHRDLDAHEASASKWKWSMRFNISQCRIVQVKKGKLYLYELMDSVLQKVTQAKCLGLWLSSNIDLDHQGPLLLTWFNFNPSMDK